MYIHPSTCQSSSLNTWYQETASEGALWQSTSIFIPNGPKAYGNITLYDTMAMEFDFKFTGRTNEPRLDYPENFFRIGGDAVKYGDGCDGEGSRYPSLWLNNNADTLYASVTSGASCETKYELTEYGIININTSYHIRIAFNSSIVQVDINDSWSKTWERFSTTAQDVRRVVDVWWSSNVGGGTAFNTGGGEFRNVIITSGIWTFPTTEPTTQPSVTPTTTATSPTTPPTDNRGDRSQIKARSPSEWFDNGCNFTCWQCLQQIDIVGDDASWDLMFNSENAINCSCPQQTASKRDERFIDIGQRDATHPDFFLEMEKYTDGSDELDIEYGLKINVVYWNSDQQSCNVLYFVNRNEFFGVYAQNILIITFLICDVVEAELTIEATHELMNDYTDFFAQLFDINQTQVNVTIQKGTFCSDSDRRRRLLQDQKDQQVTVVIVFSSTEDATAAQQNVCNEVIQQFPNIEPDTCTINDDSDEYDEDPIITEATDIIFGLNTLHIAIIIAALAVFYIIICIILYCSASHKKKKEKESLEMEYRKRTLSGTTTAKQGVVTQGKRGHTRQDSDEIQHNGSMYALKSLSNMNDKNNKSNDAIHGIYNSENSVEITKYDGLPETPKNTLPTATGTLSGNGSPYTLLASYTASDTFGNKEYKSEKEMIDEVVNAHKAHDIQYSELSIHEQIGKGQFGAVYRATWEGNVVVIKQLNNAEIDENDTEKVRKRKDARRKEMEAEIVLASSMPTHKNLVEIFGYIQSPFGIVMSYMQGDSVQKYVYRMYKKQRDSIPNIREVLIILRKAASGLKFLHEYGLVHRDVACRNILLGEMNENGVDTATEVRISDFGLTRELADKDNEDYVQRTQATFGPLKWMAPESIRSRKYSKKTDVYMFGITMWEIFYGMEPYIGMSAGTVAIKVVKKGGRPRIIDDPVTYRYTAMPQGYQVLMQNCWHHQSEKRPSFADIIHLLSQIEKSPV